MFRPVYYDTTDCIIMSSLALACANEHFYDTITPWKRYKKIYRQSMMNSAHLSNGSKAMAIDFLLSQTLPGRVFHNKKRTK